MRRTHRTQHSPACFVPSSISVTFPLRFSILKSQPKAESPLINAISAKYSISNIPNIPKYAPTHTPTHLNPHFIAFPICLCPRTCGPSNLKVRPKSNGTNLYIYTPILPHSTKAHTHTQKPRSLLARLFSGHRKGKSRLTSTKPD